MIIRGLSKGGALYNKVIRSNPVDFVPFYPKTEAMQHVKHIMFGGLVERPFLNPYADMVSGYKDQNRSLMMAQMEVKQNLSFLTEGLRFRTMFNTIVSPVLISNVLIAPFIMTSNRLTDAQENIRYIPSIRLAAQSF